MLHPTPPHLLRNLEITLHRAHAYCAGVSHFNSTSSVVLTQPEELSLYQQAVHTLCLADEDKHIRQLNFKCSNDHLFAHQLLIQIDPSFSVLPHQEPLPSEMKTVSEA